MPGGIRLNEDLSGIAEYVRTAKPCNMSSFPPISHLSLYPCDVEWGAESSLDLLVDKGKTQMFDQHFFFKSSVTLQVLCKGTNVIA